MPVAFDTAGMERHDERTWFDPRTGDQVSLTYIGMVPDIPAPLDDLPTLRRKLAEETAETGAIIEAHVVRLGGVPALFQLIKLPIPGQDTGLAFIAAFTVPRATCSAVLRIQCTEGPLSGVRESTVAAQVGFENCFPPHPYAPELVGQLPYNVADEASWDQQFLDHPLTRARVWSHRTMATAQVDPQFAELPPFQPGVRVQDHWSPPEPAPAPVPAPEPIWSAPEAESPREQTPWSVPKSEPPRPSDPRWQHSAGSELDPLPPEQDVRPRHPFGADPNGVRQPTHEAPSEPHAFGSERAAEPGFIPAPEPEQPHPFGTDPTAPRQPAQSHTHDTAQTQTFAADQDPIRPFGADAEPTRQSASFFAPEAEPPQPFGTELSAPRQPAPSAPSAPEQPSFAHEPTESPGQYFFGNEPNAAYQPAPTPAPEPEQQNFFGSPAAPVHQPSPEPDQAQGQHSFGGDESHRSAPSRSQEPEPPSGQHSFNDDPYAARQPAPFPTPEPPPRQRFFDPEPVHQPGPRGHHRFGAEPNESHQPASHQPAPSREPVQPPDQHFFGDESHQPAAPRETAQPPGQHSFGDDASHQPAPPQETGQHPFGADASHQPAPPQETGQHSFGADVSRQPAAPRETGQHSFGADVSHQPAPPREPVRPAGHHSFGAQPDPMAFGSEADPMRQPVPPSAPPPPQPVIPEPTPGRHQTSFFAPEQAFDAAPPDVRPNLFAPEPVPEPVPVPVPVQTPVPEPAPEPEKPPAEAGDVLSTVLVGLPVGAYLPLWQEDGVTFWRMLDPDAVRARLGTGVESRSEVDKRRYREAAMFSPSRGTLFLMDRYRDDAGHLGGTSTQLAPATEEEAYAAVDDKALSGLYAWLGEVVLGAVGRGEFVAVESGGWKVPMTPVVLVMLRTDGREWHSVVEASPVPVGAPVWRDQQPVDGDTQVLASPATDQTLRASGLLTRFAVSTWGRHPFELGLSFGPNPTLQQQ